MAANESATVTVTDASFADDVLLATKPVIVDFWAPWCQPCRVIAPVLEEIAARYPNVTIAKVDVDDNPQVAQDYRVLSIPTLLVFKGGKVVKQVVGAKPKPALLAEFAEYL